MAVQNNDTNEYSYPSDGQAWDGFEPEYLGKINGSYNFSFPYGGKITFTAFASTDTTIKFKFEFKVYPNTAPHYYTEDITITQNSQEFSIDISSTGSNTFA